MHQQFEKVVNLRLRAEVVTGARSLPSADPNWNDIAAQGERILIGVVVADVQDPITTQSKPFGIQSISLIGGLVHHKVYYLLASEHVNARQFLRRCENQPTRRRFIRRLAIVYGQRESLVFDPKFRKEPEICLQ
ncbi:MAG: hypothetical protein WB341_09290 [Terracidiphilus sp.]